MAEILWGGGSFDLFHCVSQTPDGGYIVAGCTESFGAGSSDFWILRIDAGGQVRWQEVLGGPSLDVALSIRQGLNGTFTVLGYTKSFGAGNDDFWFLKLDADGAVVWQRTLGGANSDTAADLVMTPDGGCLVVGYTESFGGTTKIWTVKLDADGGVEWQKAYGSASDAFPGSVNLTSDGGYVISGSPDGYVLKLDSAGDVEWQKTYGRGSYDALNSIQESSSGGYLASGRTGSFGAGLDDFWILALDEGGEITWERTYGGSKSEWTWSSAARITSSGGYVMAGITDSYGSGEDDVWIVRVDAAGLIDGCSVVDDSASFVVGNSMTTTITFADAANTLVIPLSIDSEISSSYAKRVPQCALPEIGISGGGNSIPDGDVTPSTSDDTDFGPVALNEGTKTNTFTITNSGEGSLILTSMPCVVIGGLNATDFTLALDADGSVSGGGETTFAVTFDPSTAGLRTATISIPCNDVDKNPYDFAIQGTGADDEEIDVQGGSPFVSIADGDNSPSEADGTDFGLPDDGTGAVVHAFTIRNDGAADLILSGAPKVSIGGTHADDFSVTSQLTGSVASGETTTFTVRFSPKAPGLRTATISIPNSDADENPYDFAIQGGGIRGDIDRNGLNNVVDVQLCLQIAAGVLAGTLAQRYAADVDNDSDVDMDDARILAEFVIGLRSTLP